MRQTPADFVGLQAKCLRNKIVMRHDEKIGTRYASRKFVFGIFIKESGVLYSAVVPAQYRFIFPEIILSRIMYVPASWSA